MTHRRYAVLFFAVALALSFLSYRFSSDAPPPAGSAAIAYGVPLRVALVIDGDTVELASGARLRYVGIDTPEAHDPRKPLQCYALEATAENKRLVEGKDVIIYKDVSTIDVYDRYLGFVYLTDGTFVNLSLVRDGFAFAYPYKPDTSKAAEFAAAEDAARVEGRGLWTSCDVRTTANGRKQTNALPEVY